jgi:hypothetical protein
VTIGENGITENDLLVHDIYLKDPSVAFMLARMEQPDFPQPVGIFRAIERPTYEDMMVDQIDAAVAKSGPGSLEKLINSGDTWSFARKVLNPTCGSWWIVQVRPTKRGWDWSHESPQRQLRDASSAASLADFERK